MDEKLIRKNLNQLDGTLESAIKLLMGAGIPLTDEDIETLGGMPDEQSGKAAPVSEVEEVPAAMHQTDGAACSDDHSR